MILFEALKIAANAGLSKSSSDLFDKMQIEIKKLNLESCPEHQKMIQLGTVFIDSIQWLQGGTILDKSLQDLQQINTEDWEVKNNIGVCNFHKLNVIGSVEQYESCLQAQIL